MSDDDADPGSIVESEISGSTLLIRSPTARFTVSEHVDYHIVLDQELSQLSRPEAGIFGAVEFALLGAAIGFLPQAVATLANVTETPPVPASVAELWAMMLAPTCIAGAVACLVIFGIAKYRNRGIEDDIRRRPKTTGSR